MARRLLAGPRGRTEFSRQAGIAPTTMREWELGGVQPDWGELAYLLSWWHVRLGWVVTGDGTMIQEHKLHDAQGLLEHQVNFHLVRTYLMGLLAGCQRNPYKSYIEELGAAKDDELPAVIARVSLLLISDLITRLPQRAGASADTDWDALQMTLTHTREATRIAEKGAKYGRRKKGK